MTGALFWGVGGTVSKKLFEDFNIDVEWLVATRLLIAGLLLLGIQFFRQGSSQIIGVWKSKTTAVHLLIFGLLGMLAVQYTYMASIEKGNAAVATLLQYLAPAMIICYLLIRRQKRLRSIDIVAVSLSLIGSFFLLTNGTVSSLVVPNSAVIWGVLSGVALAFYTLYPIKLLKTFNSLVIVGWAMIIGGMALSIFHPPWQMNMKQLPLEAYLYLVFVIIFGTMIAFWFYIESLQALQPSESSLLGSIEPLAAVLTTVFWLNDTFGTFQWAGTACIMGMIVFVAFSKEEVLETSSADFEDPARYGL